MSRAALIARERASAQLQSALRSSRVSRRCTSIRVGAGTYCTFHHQHGSGFFDSLLETWTVLACLATLFGRVASRRKYERTIHLAATATATATAAASRDVVARAADASHAIQCTFLPIPYTDTLYPMTETRMRMRMREREREYTNSPEAGGFVCYRRDRLRLVEARRGRDVRLWRR